MYLLAQTFVYLHPCDLLRARLASGAMAINARYICTREVKYAVVDLVVGATLGFVPV
ncbi:hypothetical protein DPMN_136540 [Dreissena polymorpha]|uniref:Uncharacterized protein n=1 Tax=Dreissena polymorpha TaxID=45954 RepID=A0A9D4JFM3_DREPO|nr:hypothetical protein DPMN_136540 [Dreissena polymorpha]